MSLFRPAFETAPYTFSGDHLREIAFPLGGIGTGCISLDGRGGLRDWEIFGRPNKNTLMEKTFPCLWLQEEGEEPKAMALLGPRVRNWVGEGAGFWNYGHGQFFKQMDGLPGFDSVEFLGTFPMARVKFHKDGLPLQVELAAFNPFIPLDCRSSSFPGACLVYRLKNRSNRKVKASLAWTMMNPVAEGFPPSGEDKDRCSNHVVRDGAVTGILFSNDRFSGRDHRAGTACLSTTWSDVSLLPQWSSGAWFDAVQSFWTEFRETGRLEGHAPVSHQERSPGTLAACVTLEPGEEVEVPFFISWTFPHSVKYWGGDSEPKAEPWTPWHATQWPDAWQAAKEFHLRRDELTEKTLAFEEALFTSDLPPEIIQSVSATTSILHSPTVIRLEDGSFWAWEGCSCNEGCCTGSCTHVWNYSVAQAWLFPEMQESMRRTDYKNSFNCGPQGREGAMNFRVMIPLGAEAPLWHAASDGQLGGVVQLYRDWRITGDQELVEDLWPAAKRALEFSWVQWDRDQDGLVDGDQHNTYDINFQGPNPLTQFFYLAALKAGAAIAAHLGDVALSAKYLDLAERGRKLTEERLWNGRFFVQESPFTEKDAPKYQHGHGCLSDQVFGQLCASLAGLGDLVDPELVKRALKTIYDLNFQRPLGDHENLQRVFAMPDEPGLILCSWPDGGRPFYPFVYSDEVWTGIEYQVATHLALVGLKEEALDIVKGIRLRYDGRRRNPWNEFECGSHYARAMAAYGLLIAFCGFKHDAVAGLTRASEQGRFFYCTPQGWGQMEVSGSETELRVRGLPA